jgi:hypothetical protein
LPRFILNCNVAVGGFLGDSGRLDVLQSVLREQAPNWSSALHIKRPRSERTIIDMSVPGSLAAAVLDRALERGAAFHALSDELGAGMSTRKFGHAELGGRDASLVVVVSVDENLLSQAGDRWTWGNQIVLQVGRSKIEGLPAAVWVRRALEDLSEGLSPFYGHAELHEEYDAKNMVHDDDGTRAVGVDVRRHLPGLYWLNFFGRPYCQLIGEENILGAPAPEIRRVDAGILVALDENPASWSSEPYRKVEGRVRVRIGEEFFFTKEQPDRLTRAPVF